MNNDVKEILDYFKKYMCIEDCVKLSKIEDYITNLQEENEKIKLEQTIRVFDCLAELIKNNETCTYRYLIYDLLGFKPKNYAELMSGLTITNALVDLQDYKQKINKALNKIQYIIDYGFDYDGFNTVESLKGLIDMLVDYARKSKDILKGEKEE